MKNKKGFTLIELIVSMAVAAIFVICAIATISPTYKTYNHVEAASDSQVLTESLLENIRNKANFSNSLTAGTEEGSENGIIRIDNTKIIRVSKDGYLQTDATLDFAPEFYGGKTITMETAQKGDNCVDVTINVLQDGRQLFTVTSTLKPILKLADTYDIYTPEGMLRVAREEIARVQALSTEEYKEMEKKWSATGRQTDGKNDVIFSNMLENPYGRFPEYSFRNIMSKEKLDGIIKASKAPKQWQAQPYLCCFITKKMLIPIPYVTYNIKNKFQKTTHAPALAIYFDGQWYIPETYAERYLTTCNEKDEAGIRKWIETDWISVSEIK